MARTQATKLFRNYFTFGHVAIVGFTLCSAEIIRYQDFVFFKTRICASTMFFAFTTNVLAGELVRIYAIVTLYLFIFSAELGIIQFRTHIIVNSDSYKIIHRIIGLQSFRFCFQPVQRGGSQSSIPPTQALRLASLSDASPV